MASGRRYVMGGIALALGAAACLAGAEPALAYTKPGGEKSIGANEPPHALSCADFKRSNTGSWSPLQQVTVQGVNIAPGAAIEAGKKYGDVDLAAVLEQQCPH